MRILAIVQGEYGRRIVANIQQRGPPAWIISTWEAPSILPPVIDDPGDFLPQEMPPADLVLSLGEQPGVAELLPEIVRLSAARAVIAPIDNVAWLPPGLMNQVARWLDDLGVAAVFPKPFCSLTETTYNARRHQREYHDPLIAEFARHFGRPAMQVMFDNTHPAAPVGASANIAAVQVVRDAACGCARYVAEHLTGVSAEEAEHKAGLLHHHYPCLASMSIDTDYNDTLMHVSGHILREAVAEPLKAYKPPPAYFQPSGLLRKEGG